MLKYLKLVTAGLCVFIGSTVQAQKPVTIGVTISSTGPAASLGIAQRNTVELFPETLGGRPVNYVVLDDATDPSQATRNARRLVEVENVDAIIGSSTTPNNLAVAEVSNEAKVPHLGLAPYTAKDQTWTFSLPQTYALMYDAVFKKLQQDGVKTIAFFGFSDALGDASWREVEQLAEQYEIDVVAHERYRRTDQSVTAQALKVIQSKADAVVFAASGSAAALPMRALRERGYKGPFFQNHGVANNDFLRVADKMGEGMIAPTGLVLVAEQLPDNHPSKSVGVKYLSMYEDKYGAGSRNPFGAYAYDAYLLLDRAIASVDGSVEAGTPEFRTALLKELEKTDQLALTHGTSSLSADNHLGLREDAVVLITIKDGQWRLTK
ncbi:ABC transporter substrate-binding protein [Pusillimonas sp. DMV24BSW_D]|uniref:ABC transporter substrate-binding protein n=1 Tax=Neopusillimonas aestuarii TaxID=2716226 RepID=UPI00140DDACA|nr:ABC transporter substrate-binding protein [Pusillimonas sp. DMV24BSW_D]QIM47906.1 ABC transporter substrate-binding protein [Pusillimonas sp. DMV24BSW_D]